MITVILSPTVKIFRGKNTQIIENVTTVKSQL